MTSALWAGALCGPAACSPLTETEPGTVTAACPDPERDLYELYERALRADGPAARCWIAISEAYPDSVSLESDRVAVRYMLWIIERERPDDILELAAQHRRVDLIRTLELTHFLLEIGVNTTVMPDGCTLRPPEMQAVWLAAQPGGGSQACDHAILPPTPAYDALTDAERRHMGRCWRRWRELGSDYDGAMRADGAWLPEDCLQYTEDGGWVGMGHPGDNRDAWPPAKP